VNRIYDVTGFLSVVNVWIEAVFLNLNDYLVISWNYAVIFLFLCEGSSLFLYSILEI